MDGLQSQLDNLLISSPTQEGSQGSANATMQAFFEIRVNLIRTAVQGALDELSLLREVCSEISIVHHKHAATSREPAYALQATPAVHPYHDDGGPWRCG